MPEDFPEEALEQAILAHCPDATSASLARIPTGKFNTSYYVGGEDREMGRHLAEAHAITAD